MISGQYMRMNVMCMFTDIQKYLRENFVVSVHFLIISEVSCIRVPGSKLCKGINYLTKYRVTCT